MAANFDNQVVIVTGGSSGIGQAIAVAFAEAGAKVVISGRKQAALDETAALNPNIYTVQADIQSESDASKIVARALEVGGRIDVLVNNAGIFGMAPVEAVTSELVESLFKTNVFGLTYITREAIPHLKETKGSVINIGSVVGHKASAGMSHYAATKAAVESLTASWAGEFAPYGVRVNNIAPGPVDTPIFGNSLPAEYVEGAKQQMAATTLIGRLGQSKEIAYWAVRLADPEVTWVTGQTFTIDGGVSVK